MSNTIADLLANHPAQANAIGAPDRRWMSYGQLRELSEKTIGMLASMGIGPDQRVAIVLPNGPEMASAFITIAHDSVWR